MRCTPKIEMNPDYVDGSVNIRALFNKDYSEIYYYSSEGELLNTAKNVYNADPVKSPALIRGDRFVKHKVGDRIYAQMYTWRGEKIGPEIEFSKLFHFHMITMTGNRSSYYRGYF